MKLLVKNDCEESIAYIDTSIPIDLHQDLGF